MKMKKDLVKLIVWVKGLKDFPANLLRRKIKCFSLPLQLKKSQPRLLNLFSWNWTQSLESDSIYITAAQCFPNRGSIRLRSENIKKGFVCSKKSKLYYTSKLTQTCMSSMPPQTASHQRGSYTCMSADSATYLIARRNLCQTMRPDQEEKQGHYFSKVALIQGQGTRYTSSHKKKKSLLVTNVLQNIKKHQKC